MDVGGEVPDKNNNSRKGCVNISIKSKMFIERVHGVEETNRVSIANSTDEDIATPCSPCLGDDPPARVKAVVYCLKCEEYLCLQCKKQHRRFKTTSNHSLLDTNGLTAGESSQLPAIDTCPEHTGAAMDYYCETEGVSCCKLCVDISHSQCTGVKYIPDESMNITDSPDVNNTGETIANLSSKLKAIIQRKKSFVTRAKSQEEDAHSRVIALTNIAAGLINKLAEEAKEEIHRTGSNLVSQLGQEIETCEAASTVLGGLENKLQIVVQSNNKQQIYVMLKDATKQVEKYSEFVSKTEHNIVENNISFMTDRCFETMLQNITSMGSVVIQEAGSTQQTTPIISPSASPCGSRASLTRKRAIPIGGHSVRISEDRTTCHVSGCKFLQDGRIMLADYNNKCIKLFDGNFRPENYVRLTSRPTDLVVITQERVIEVATSLADEEMIQYVKVARTAYIGKRVQTAAPYQGLAYSKAKVLYASCYSDDGAGQIHVIDIEGNVLRTITNAGQTKPLLIRPTSLYVDDDRRILFVTDLGQNCVVCLDTNPGLTCNRQPLSRYTDRNLELRTGMITADNDDNIYVCSGNRSVHQISVSCEKVYEILTSTDGISTPHCLAYSAKDGLLLLSEYKENGVKLFKMN